jgi:thiamine biosynthesis lipoprotein
VATSGTYIRGQHIYNPHASNDAIKEVASLTVIGPTIYDADRFATAAFAMGKAGINFIESLDNYEAYLITDDRQATLTSGFERYTEPAS